MSGPEPFDGWFTDRVAVVVGAGAGLGATLARRFTVAGARVVVVARSVASLEAAAAGARDAGGDPRTIAADVTVAADMERLGAVVDAECGGADVLVNAAFAATRKQHVLDMDVDALDAWRRAVEVGGYGTLLACRYLAPAMVARGRGAVVNVTSMSSRIGFAGRSEYAAGKAAAHRLTHALADELGPAGVRVNCVAPGHIWSAVLESFYRAQADARGVDYGTVLTEYTREMALRRAVTEDEVADAVLFLASDQASGITGAVLDVNAGHLFAP